MVNGLGLWAFAADDLFLGIGLLAASWLTFKYGQLPRGHAWLGIVTGTLSCLNFIFELARFGEWRILSIVSSVVYAFVGFVMLPAWLIYLACYLGEYVVPDNRAGLTTHVDGVVGGGDDEGRVSLPGGPAASDRVALSSATATARDADDERL